MQYAKVLSLIFGYSPGKGEKPCDARERGMMRVWLYYATVLDAARGREGKGREGAVCWRMRLAAIVFGVSGCEVAGLVPGGHVRVCVCFRVADGKIMVSNDG